MKVLGVKEEGKKPVQPKKEEEKMMEYEKEEENIVIKQGVRVRCTCGLSAFSQLYILSLNLPLYLKLYFYFFFRHQLYTE